ncbi:MAG: hypothetical protein AUK63_1954 [bacterium P3]|nr:MAG: hypothetical protein AUK63_1954 [bacterium P3]KWW40962.1 MAG: hypothetical protein F083_1306 [bacterium F083]
MHYPDRIMEDKTIEISPSHIDIGRILETKQVRAPRLLLRWMNRLLHVDELNAGIYMNRHLTGIPFVHKFLEGTEPYNLGVKLVVEQAEHIPTEGSPIIAGNHPLGGPDGLAVMAAVGRRRNDVQFPVNDFLMHLPGLAPLFVPIDKVHRNSRNADVLEKAFAGPNALLYFPAGLCSRKQKDGSIRDLEWKPTVIKKAQRYGRDIVPFFFDAQNRRRFYNLARLREKMGIRFNFEMALLPAEMFAQRGKTMRIVFGRPIPHTVFDQRHTAREWAALLREHVYKLKYDPQDVFCPA